MDKQKCKALLANQSIWLPPNQTCSRAAVRDGYCRMHHPDAKAYAMRRKNGKG